VSSSGLCGHISKLRSVNDSGFFVQSTDHIGLQNALRVRNWCDICARLYQTLPNGTNALGFRCRDTYPIDPEHESGEVRSGNYLLFFYPIVFYEDFGWFSCMSSEATSVPKHILAALLWDSLKLMSGTVSWWISKHSIAQLSPKYKSWGLNSGIYTEYWMLNLDTVIGLWDYNYVTGENVAYSFRDNILYLEDGSNRLFGLVVRVPGCKSRGPGFDFRRYHIFRVAVNLERSPLSFVT
jgi:hypothetical protein